MYNSRKVQLFEPHPHSVLARRKAERGMQMLVIYGALTWAVLGFALYLTGCSF